MNFVYFPSSLTLYPYSFFFFFFNDTATTEIYTLSLHDALPILPGEPHLRGGPARAGRPLRRRGLDGAVTPGHSAASLHRAGLLQLVPHCRSHRGAGWCPGRGRGDLVVRDGWRRL